MRAMPRRLLAAALLLFTATAAACDSSSSPQPSPSASASAKAETKRITQDDCGRWADHGTSVVIDDFTAAASRCPDDVRATVDKQFGGNRSQIRAGAYTGCVQHVGESYSTKDSSCFMTATNAREMVGCKFAPMTNKDDSDWPSMIETIRTRCNL
jgi:hypothetical protein